MTERQEYLKFIKERYPIGSEVNDITCSQLYYINKRTVFEAHPWKPEDYNDLHRPEKDKDYFIEFTCHNPGKHERIYSLDVGLITKGDILMKYKTT